ncbi:MAG: putative radial spoke head 1 [Streblomastix strix]|uniref:Putative radial spoke head 1 n=1 Tax=Streblomastix strix TaxID=222440 RepID=A0A5J4UXI0_9EUKA|nr:MAG: putative radial spoke head 1 [Streblomastix strix]
MQLLLQINGPGKYFWKNPIAKYVGSYMNHRKDGYGLMKYPDGSLYDGNFHVGKRHGEGTYTYPNGDTYVGEWADGKKHGKGIFYIKKKNMKYTGMWCEGQIVRGIWQIKDGSYYVSKFEKQLPNIEGRFVQVNGNSVEGTFKEETKTIEVPIEKEKKDGEEGQEEEEEGKEPELLFKQLEKITVRQFYPHTFTESTPEQVAADNFVEVQTHELDAKPWAAPPE